VQRSIPKTQKFAGGGGVQGSNTNGIGTSAYGNRWFKKKEFKKVSRWGPSQERRRTGPKQKEKLYVKKCLKSRAEGEKGGRKKRLKSPAHC